MARHPAWGGGRFVGRDRELAVIAAACAAAAEGRCQVVVVSGPAGIGKTTLCAEAMARAERDGFAVAWGHGWPDGGAPPLWPWASVLTALTGRDAAHVLGEPHLRITMDADRFARFAAVADLLAARADRSPVAIVLDDAHLADTAALLLARFVRKALAASRVVIVVARRDGAGAPDVRRSLDDLERDADLAPLRAFDEAETAAFVRAHDRDGDDLAPALVRLTGGSPLLLSRAVLAPSPAGDLIDQSLDALTPEQRDVLALASILGSEGSTGELRAMVGGTHADLVAALDVASARGLIDRRPGGWAFTHELVRRAAAAVLTTEEVMDAHVRARDLAPFDDRPPASARRAHHALAAAERSDADARRAIADCRAAARLLGRGFDYERAVGLLASAADLVERVAAPADRVGVLLEHADALLVVGRLPDARRAYERADDVAGRAGDPIARARAALGLGGVWVNEIRDQVGRARMLARQRAALADVPVTERGLRARLRVRLAAEAVYDGAPVEPVLDALDEARGVEDPRVLAEALSLAHHGLLAAEHLELRRQLAAELVTVATACGDDLRALFGLLWRAVDEFLAGDPYATRTLSELRTRAEALGCRTIEYIVAAIDVMLLIRAGRLAEAEAAAEECFELGGEVGDADATGYYGAHIITIRWLQDRDGELLDLARQISGGADLIVPEFAYRAGVASMAARAGLTDEATTMLAALCADGLDTLPRSSTWLTGIVNIVEAASLLGDRGLAADGARLLAPFADRPVMPSLAVTCFGSVERALGMAAMTCGDADGAVTHLERAVEHNVRFGNRPMAAMCRADLAAARRLRDGPGDRAAGAALLRRAANAAATMGMTARAERWRREAAAIADEIEAAGVTTLRHGVGGWVLEHGGRRIELGELVGVGYLAALVSQPGVEVSALELCGGADVDAAFQQLIDPRALHEYRSRVAALDTQLAGAGTHGPRAQRLERERDALRDELAASLAVSGRSRRFTDSGERARTAVRKAIARVLDVVERSDPALANELRAAITTGRTCAYRPAPAHCGVVVEA